MTWGSGASVFSDVIDALQAELPGPGLCGLRKRIYLRLIPAFQSHDWDTETDCLGLDPAFDEAFYLLYPDYLHTDERDW